MCRHLPIFFLLKDPNVLQSGFNGKYYKRYKVFGIYLQLYIMYIAVYVDVVLKIKMLCINTYNKFNFKFDK